VGRPRADRRRRERPPEDEILFVAARLFAEHGFAGTSTRAIAAAAGLRQPSLFHWFPSKEAILERLLERSLAPSLAFAEQVAAERDRAGVRLYRVLRFDALHLCTYPFDPTIVFSPEARAPHFARFWNQRERIVALLRDLVASGIRSGEFARADAELSARTLIAMDEAVLTWNRRSERWSPEAISDQLAGFALRMVLADPADLDAIRRDAAARDAATTSARASAASPTRRAG
jgi:AcrR family transcriptional regulator